MSWPTIFGFILMAGAIYFAVTDQIGFCIIWTAMWHALITTPRRSR